ncbi:calcium-binding protein [Rhizobium sp. FKL33]|uniref:calcium-binding protein n=1 Tax=Rhizobium sp. FKL33 TaxID=2562307 RepID=UPI0010C01687|nr:calcium-binding protein [Rhizobium sp. FKL33]
MSWTGRKLFYSYLFPNRGTSYVGDLDKSSLYSGDITVGSDVEIGKNAELFQIDVYEKGFFIDFKKTAVWSKTVFNGPVFADKYGEIEKIRGFTLNTNITNLTKDDVRLSHRFGATSQDEAGEDALAINLGGLATTQYSYIFITFKIKLNTVFAEKLNDKDNTVTGTALGDRMNGKDGKDTLDGAGGDDQLIGGKGDDRLTGGEGDDQFIFDRYSSDIVTDFNKVKDDDDRLGLAGIPEIGDYKDLVDNHMTQKGANVVIDFGNGETATILGVTIKEIGREDVLV